MHVRSQTGGLGPCVVQAGCEHVCQLGEGGSHTDRGAGASNGLIVLSQSCLQEFMGQVVPSDYPNNLSNSIHNW